MIIIQYATKKGEIKGFSIASRFMQDNPGVGMNCLPMKIYIVPKKLYNKLKKSRVSIKKLTPEQCQKQIDLWHKGTKP